MARAAPGRRTWGVVNPGSEYRFTIRTADGDLSRIDPYAREMTSSVGNGIVYDPTAFDWGDDAPVMPTWDELVIYEMHIGTLGAVGGSAAARSTARGGDCAISSTSACRRSRSCRRSSSPATSRGATTRRTCSPSSRRVWRARRVQGVHPRGA